MQNQFLKNKLKMSALLGLVGALLMLFVVIFSYTQILNYYPKFNICSNWMSELGVGPNVVIFNITVIISSILFSFFFIALIKKVKLNEGNVVISNICLVFGLSSLLGLFLIGAFPMRDIGEPNIYHGFGALIYWSSSVFFWGILTIIFKDNPNFNKRVKITITLTFIAWSLFLSSFLILILIEQVDDNFPIIFQWIAHLFSIFSIFSLVFNLMSD